MTDRAPAPTAPPNPLALIRHAADAIAVLDAQYKIAYISSAVEAMLGYRPDELMGQSAFEHLHPDDVDPTRRRFAAVDDGNDSPDPLEFRVLCRNGRWNWLEVSATNCLSIADISGIVAVYRNVTERRSLIDKREQRARLDGALLLARTVAHQLNNSLSPVVGFAELAATRDSVAQDPIAANYLRLIAEAGQEATNRVARLQRIVRLEPDPQLQEVGHDVLDVRRSTEPTPL